MRSYFTAGSVTILAALGLAAGLFAFPARADAPSWNIGQLPAGYIVQGQPYTPDGCTLYGIQGGTAFTTAVSCWSDFQTKIDAFVSETICTVNLEAGQAAGICATPEPVAVTTTTPPTTQTVAAPTDVTTAAGPATPTSDAPPQVVTVTVTDPTVDARLADLQAQLDALSHRVDAIAKANTASWTAFVDAVGAGASAADAALAARSAGENAIYGLGQNPA